MKKNVFTFVLVCFAFVVNSYAQQDEDEEIYDIPFAVIEQKPMFAECKDVEKSEQEQCFKKQLNKHIITHFRYPEEALKKNYKEKW